MNDFLHRKILALWLAMIVTAWAAAAFWARIWGER